MRIYFISYFTIFISLLLTHNLIAQDATSLFPCGTPSAKDPWLTHFQLHKSDYLVEGDSTFYIPLSIHVLGSDDGAGYYTTNKLMNAICQLNMDFEPSNIQFYTLGGIHFIDAQKWYNHENILVGADMMFTNNIENTINCYIVANPAGNCGYNLPYAGIALSKGCIGTGNHTWAHEMGHNLSLPHPFLGWEGDQYNYNVETPRTVTYDYTLFKDSLILDTTIIDTALVESVERTNCLLAADGFCDTRPDYISRRWQCNQNGESPDKFKDFNEIDFKVDGTLYMSYSDDACQNRFSADQIDAMRATLVHRKPELITNPIIPEPLTFDYQINYPIEDEFVPFDDIEFNWEKIKGADKYYIEVSLKSRFSRIVHTETTSGNTITLNNLAKNRKYYWRIYAYGPFNYCTDKSATYSFNTNDVSSTDNAIKPLSNITTSWSDHGELLINMNTNSPISLNMTISNVYGQIMSQKLLHLQEGEHDEIIKNSTNWPNGSYYVVMMDKNHQIRTKIILKTINH